MAGDPVAPEFGGVRELIERMYGGRTRHAVNPVTATVATTSTLILRENPNRAFWFVQNLSGNFGFLGFDAQVSSTRGARIEPNGGGARASVLLHGYLTTLPVHARLDTSSGTFFVFEIELVPGPARRFPAAPPRMVA